MLFFQIKKPNLFQAQFHHSQSTSKNPKQRFPNPIFSIVDFGQPRSVVKFHDQRRCQRERSQVQSPRRVSSRFLFLNSRKASGPRSCKSECHSYKSVSMISSWRKCSRCKRSSNTNKRSTPNNPLSCFPNPPMPYSFTISSSLLSFYFFNYLALSLIGTQGCWIRG